MVRNYHHLILIGIFALVLSRGTAFAEVMFEGYSVIRTGSTPAGYAVQRYEFDPKKKQFTSIYYIKMKDAQGGYATESAKAVANDKFQPVSLQYTVKSGDMIKMIDAKFVKDKMTATVSDGKSRETLKADVKKGTFLSTFLTYLMLQNGYKTDKKFTYAAIAEEDAQTYTGEATIKGEEEFKGQKVYRVEYTFKGAGFTSFITPKGEVLGSSSPLQQISTELVASAAEATKGFIVKSDELKTLFGTVPTGKINVLAARVSEVMPAQATEPIPPAAPVAQPTQPKPLPAKAPVKDAPDEPSLPSEPKSN